MAISGEVIASSMANDTYDDAIIIVQSMPLHAEQIQQAAIKLAARQEEIRITELALADAKIMLNKTLGWISLETHDAGLPFPNKEQEDEANGSRYLVKVLEEKIAELRTNP